MNYEHRIVTWKEDYSDDFENWERDVEARLGDIGEEEGGRWELVKFERRFMPPEYTVGSFWTLWKRLAVPGQYYYGRRK